MNVNHTYYVQIPTTGWTNGYYRSMPQGRYYDGFGIERDITTSDAVYWSAGDLYSRTMSVKSITGLKWKRDTGGALTNDAFGSYPNFYIDAPPPPTANVCFTNKTSGPGDWVLVIGNPPNQYIESQTLAPGDWWCLTIQTNFVLYTYEIFPSIQGPPTTNATPIFSWTPGDGNVTSNAVVDPPPKTVNTQQGAFNSPTNDTQKSANGIIGQLQNNQQQENVNANRIAGILEEIRDKVATNSPAGDSQTNLGAEASGAAAGVVSNSTYTYFSSGTGAVASAIGNQGGSVAPSDLPTIEIPIGADFAVAFNPFDNPKIISLRNWMQRLILYTAKLIAILYLFRALCMSLKDFAFAMKGNGTSGFLQAAFVSIPNLFSSLGGFALRWKLVAFALPFIFVAMSGYIIQLNAIDDMPGDFSGLVPANEQLAWGWAWFTYLVPIEVLFRITVSALTAHLSMIFTVFAASILTDATSKA